MAHRHTWRSHNKPFRGDKTAYSRNPSVQVDACCDVCQTTFGVREQDGRSLCAGCRAILKNAPHSGHSYFDGYLGRGCRCDKCVAAAEKQRAYLRSYRKQVAS